MSPARKKRLPEHAIPFHNKKQNYHTTYAFITEEMQGGVHYLTKALFELSS